MFGVGITGREMEESRWIIDEQAWENGEKRGIN